MSEFFYKIAYYLNIENPEFWESWRRVFLDVMFMNMTLTFMAWIMKAKGNLPKILDEFPYRYLFPTTTGRFFLLLWLWYGLFYIAMWMLETKT